MEKNDLISVCTRAINDPKLTDEAKVFLLWNKYDEFLQRNHIVFDDSEYPLVRVGITNESTIPVDVMEEFIGPAIETLERFFKLVSLPDQIRILKEVLNKDWDYDSSDMVLDMVKALYSINEEVK